MLGNRDIDEKITSRTAIGSRITATGTAQGLSIIDTGRDRQLDVLLRRDVALATAVRTLLLDDLTRAMAVRTGHHLLHRTEHALLCHHHLSTAAALRTGLWLCARLRARTVTLRAGILIPDLDGLLTALDGLVEADTNTRTDRLTTGRLVSSTGTAIGGESPTTAEAEQVSENIGEVHATEVEATIACTLTSCRVRIEGCMAIGVIRLSLLRIRKNCIGLVAFLKSGFRLLITWIRIRMVLSAQIPVCLFYLIVRRIAGHS